MHYQSVFRDDLFARQVIVVTGGGSGIGRCIAHELASLGAGVVITGRQEAKLAAVAAEISADGGAVDTLAFDIRDEEAVSNLPADERVLCRELWSTVRNARDDARDRTR